MTPVAATKGMKRKAPATKLGSYIYARAAKRSPTGWVYYGDFRRFADVGGRLERLCPPNQKLATSDPDVARDLYVKRVAYYEARRRGVHLAGEGENPYLGDVIAWHLKEKARANKFARSTVERDQEALTHVFDFFGNCRLGEVTVERLGRYVEARRKEPGVRTGTLTAEGTIRNELHSLSNLFRRAVAAGKTASNPVARMVDKPTRVDEEAAYFSREDAARLLDAAASLDDEVRRAQRAAALRTRAAELGDARADREARALRAEARAATPGGLRNQNLHRCDACLEAIVATLLYTGGRSEEVLGLLVADVDFTAGQVHFRPNAYRGLKRSHCKRAVPLWPPLERILRSYLEATGRTNGLLFPSRAGGLRHGFNKQFERCLARADELATEKGRRLAPLAGGRYSPHASRHTFATMLLHTTVPTENGRRAMRSAFQVARTLGHRSAALVERTYGHLLSDQLLMDTLSYEGLRERSGRAATKRRRTRKP